MYNIPAKGKFMCIIRSTLKRYIAYITVDTPTTITYVMVVTKMAEGLSLRRVLSLYSVNY